MTTSTPLRLQVIVTEETRFLTIADPATPITGLKQTIEKEYGELYPAEEPITVLRLQDSFHNDMPLRFNIGELLKDMDKIYTVLKPVIVADTGAIVSVTPVAVPKRRGRKRKNPEQPKESPKVAKTQSNGILPTPYVSSTPQLHSNSQPGQFTPSSLATKVPSVTIIPSMPVYTPTPGTPSASRLDKESPREVERMICTPYCQVAESRDKCTICEKCGELRPYSIPDSEKGEKAHCSRWCVSSGGRKTRGSGQEYCSICVARHRAGKYPLKGGSHQCAGCHRPWLQIDEADLCRTCRKGDAASLKKATEASMLASSQGISSGIQTPDQSDSQDMLIMSSLDHPEATMISHDILLNPPVGDTSTGYPTYYNTDTKI